MSLVSLSTAPLSLHQSLVRTNCSPSSLSHHTLYSLFSITLSLSQESCSPSLNSLLSFWPVLRHLSLLLLIQTFPLSLSPPSPYILIRINSLLSLFPLPSSLVSLSNNKIFPSPHATCLPWLVSPHSPLTWFPSQIPFTSSSLFYLLLRR